MTKPVRLTLSRRAGFNLQRLSLETNGLPAVNVARPGRWGNPYVVGDICDLAQIRRWGWRFAHPEFVCTGAAEAVRRFRACLLLDEAIHDYVREKLGGRNVACWCEQGSPWCHGDPILELANSTKSAIAQSGPIIPRETDGA